MRRRTQTKPRVEGLEGRALLSTIVKETRFNNLRSSAEAFRLDPADGRAVIRGTISDRNDEDIFRLTAPGSGLLVVGAVSVGAVRAKVNVEDVAGRTLLETDPNDGINAGHVNVRAGQTISIRIRSQNQLAGAYGVALLLGRSTSTGGGSTTGSVALFREIEPNDDRSVAARFSLGADGRAILTGTSASDADRDFFTFVPRTSGRLVVNLRTVGGAVADVELEDSSGRALLELQPGDDGVATRGVNVTAGRPLFVRVRAPRSATYFATLALV